MRQVGVITMDGRAIGVVVYTEGLSGLDAAPEFSTKEPSGRSIGDQAYGGPEHYSLHPQHDGHGARPHSHQAPRENRAPSEMSNIPRSTSGNPFDRARFAKELEQKPWLREKIAHISLGENQDPKANLAVLETMMNRAVVRGTSLEAQARRHRSSGKDEGGYYAGYAPRFGDAKRSMFDRNLSEALKGSNVTNYATDNSSGGLARREAQSGAFKHHGTISGESFFSPGSAEPAFRDRWKKLNSQATEFEKGQTTKTGGAPARDHQSSVASPYQVATAVQDPKYTSDDINELIGERAGAGRVGGDTRKPGIDELDKTYDSPQQERFNRPYAYPPARDKNPTMEPQTDKDRKEPLPSRFYPPTPGDQNDPGKKGSKPGWNIPSDYDLG